MYSHTPLAQRQLGVTFAELQQSGIKHFLVALALYLFADKDNLVNLKRQNHPVFMAIQSSFVELQYNHGLP